MSPTLWKERRASSEATASPTPAYRVLADMRIVNSEQLRLYHGSRMYGHPDHSQP